MSFFERLKEERLRLGLSQEAFGAVGGVKKRAQVNYESGERKPDIDYLEKISKIGVDVLYVITGQHTTVHVSSIMPADEEVLLKQYRAAPEAVRNAALAVLLSAGQAPEGLETKKERKGRAAPRTEKNRVIIQGNGNSNIAGGNLNI